MQQWDIWLLIIELMQGKYMYIQEMDPVVASKAQQQVNNLTPLVVLLSNIWLSLLALVLIQSILF